MCTADTCAEQTDEWLGELGSDLQGPMDSCCFFLVATIFWATRGWETQEINVRLASQPAEITGWARRAPLPPSAVAGFLVLGHDHQHEQPVPQSVLLTVPPTPPPN